MTMLTRVRAAALACVGCLLALPARAQTQSAVITGKVTSEFEQPLNAANVYITELAVSVATNAQGVYTITIAPARLRGITGPVNLRVRAFGYQAQSLPVRITAGSQTHDFKLQQDVNRLSEVVVTGVVGEGTERSKVPFAVSHLTTEDLPVPAMDPVTELQGKVSGLRIASTSGKPGGTPQIQLRGVTSINTNGRSTQPLFIVDGAIMNVGSLDELGGLDIESVEVVKGAAGASLYGTRAANGVITIKTKRGGTGSDAVKFNVRTEYGTNDLNSINWGMPINHTMMLDETGSRFCVNGTSSAVGCSRTVNWMNEVMRINNVNADTTRTPVTLQGAIPGSIDLQNIYQASLWPGQYYNPIAQVIKRNPTSITSADATGKMGNVRFYVSGSYQNDQGAVRGLDGSNQRRGRVNLDYDARPDLTISVSSLYDNGYVDNRSGGGSNGTIFGQLLRGITPGTNYLATDTLGRPIVRGSPQHSPTTNGSGALLYDDSGALMTFDKSTRWLGNVSGRYFPADWVTFDGTFAYDNRQRKNQNYQIKGYRTIGLSTSQNFGNVGFGDNSDESMNGNLTATLRKSFTNQLNGRLQLRSQFDQENIVTDNSSGQQLTVKEIYTTSNTTTNKNASSSSSVVKNVGFLSGGELEYKDRYIVDASFRYDGSSLFGSGNRWAPFGRVSAVWRMGEEPWFNVPHLSEFRLRASHGTAGSTPNFTAQYETYTINNGNVTLGVLGNKNLKPETTTEDEMGTDFTLFNRLGLSATYAHDITRNQILQVNTPNSLGFATQWQNAGTLDNKTVELEANLPVITKKDFSWSMRGTWDRTRTFITQLFTPDFLFDGGTAQGTGTFFKITANPALSNGQPQNRFGQIWGRKFYKKCGDLPAQIQGQCGDGKDFQVNDEGWVVWVGQGNSWKDGITKNLWETYLPGSQSPFGDKVPLYFGMPIVDRPLRGQPGEAIGINQIIGNVFPDFRWTWTNNVTWKRITAYALIDATIGQDIYNQGEGWGLLDFASSNFDQAGKSVETAKPSGYSWRANSAESTGIGGFYDVLGPNNYVVEDGSFAKLREVSLSYRIGAVRGWGDWTVGLVGRNLFTWTNYSGLDPEVGSSGGNNTTSSLVNSVDAFGFPNLRTFTVSLATRF